MGIKGLAKLLSEEAPDCLREVPLSSLYGRKVAIDASMAIYQFLIAVRSGGTTQPSVMLTNNEGDTTSHIQGMFNRTIRFLSEGIRPVFIFDGKPPNIKSYELTKRQEKRTKAKAELKKAEEEGNVEEQEKQARRLVRAGEKENDDCVKLLKLMGVPVVLAPCEAEAQAAALNRAGIVWAVATEDMDALTFRTTILLRKMTFASASKTYIHKMEYSKAIEGLGLTHDQFVDLCILLGCDYCDTIRGVGPKTALKLVRKYGCIEIILDNIDRKKFTVPQSWEPDEIHGNIHDNTKVANLSVVEKLKEPDKVQPIYVQARHLFNNHDVHSSVQLKWSECQPEKLTKFLVDEMGFNEERVKSNIEKLQKAFKAISKPQMRMDTFFKVKPYSRTKRKLKGKQENDGKKKK